MAQGDHGWRFAFGIIGVVVICIVIAGLYLLYQLFTTYPIALLIIPAVPLIYGLGYIIVDKILERDDE